MKKKKFTKKQKSLKDLVLKEYKKGNIVLATPFGFTGAPLKEFVKQPIDGMLYDLNRNEAVILTFIEDVKWVNDYAMAQVVRELKLKVDIDWDDIVKYLADYCMKNNCIALSPVLIVELLKTKLGC